MNRYRKVATKIHRDQKFPYLSKDARLLFYYHLTSERSTPFLLYVEGEGSMTDNAKIGDFAEVRQARVELDGHGMARYANDGSNLVFLPNALRLPENAPDGGNSLKTWINLFNQLPRTAFFFECVKHWQTMLPQIDHKLTREFVQSLEEPLGNGARVPHPPHPGKASPPIISPKNTTPMPDPFVITDAMQSFVDKECKFDEDTVQSELVRFREYYQGVERENWYLTFTNWMRKAKEIRAQFGKKNSRKPLSVHVSTDRYYINADHNCQHGLYHCVDIDCPHMTFEIECKNLCPFVNKANNGVIRKGKAGGA